MASTRKPAPRKPEAARPSGADAAHRADRLLLASLEAAVVPLVRASKGAIAEPCIAIAYSGGPDSTVLLDLACRLRERGAPGFGRLVAVHVNHGLLPQADEWTRHCEQTCRRLDLPLFVERVAVRRGRGGIEEAARQARLASFARIAKAHGLAAVLLAHHRDDRLETFLLQWLRGSGPRGLVGPARSRALPGGGNADHRETLLLRPLLDVERSQLLDYARRHGLTFVDDPSNADPRFARAVLRGETMRTLAAIRPGFRASAARAMDLLALHVQVVDEIVAGDLAACRDAAHIAALKVDALCALPAPRASLALRAWLEEHGSRMPPRSRLDEFLRQLRVSRPGARTTMAWEGRELRFRGGLLRLVGTPPAGLRRDIAALRWLGEPELAVPAWDGRFEFLAVADGGAGFDAARLRGGPLTVAPRRGGERIQLHAARPTRTLKQAYQQAGIDDRTRAGLPLLWHGDELLYAAGLGADVRRLGSGGSRVRVEWRPAPGREHL